MASISAKMCPCARPVHAAESYLERLIRQGHRVAVCEQMEDPAEAKNAVLKPLCAAMWCAW